MRSRRSFKGENPKGVVTGFTSLISMLEPKHNWPPPVKTMQISIAQIDLLGLDHP